MPTFDELIKNKKVANHPLLRGYQNLSKVRENMSKHSQNIREELTDVFSMGYAPEEKTRNINDMIREASLLVGDVFAQFNLPTTPKFYYMQSKDIKHARNDDTRVVEGSILFKGEFVSLMGVKKTATIPVTITAGDLVPPSVMEIDGSLHVIGQDSLDQVLRRNTTYDLPQLREGYQTPPMNRVEREMAVDIRNQVGLKPRENDKTLYMNQKKSTRKEAVGMVPRAWAQVVSDMETAEKEGKDTFPRSWIHVLRNYILDHVSTAAKDAWEPHLINAGFCINPYGGNMNRGRSRLAKRAQDQSQLEKDLFRELMEQFKDAKESWAEEFGSSEGFDEWFQEEVMRPADEDFGKFSRRLRAQMSQYPTSYPKEEVVDRDHGLTELLEDLFQTYRASLEAWIGENGSDAGFLEYVSSNIEGPAWNWNKYTVGKRAQDVKADFEKDIEMEVEGPIEEVGVDALLEDEVPAKDPKFYPETKTPIEHGDGVRVRKGPNGNPFKGTIVEVDEENDFLIIKSKGMEYRVSVDDIEPVPSTFKKMYM